jgi:hypothetical protein
MEKLTISRKEPMTQVVIKNQDGKYLGGGKQPELVDRPSRAYLYEDGPEVDAQLSIVNTLFGCGWFKANAQKEYDQTTGG